METMKITKARHHPLMNAYHLINHGQITAFDGAELTISGCIALNLNGRHICLLQSELVKEATQLMIDNGIVITNESEKVGV
jgi:hypothetical protein